MRWRKVFWNDDYQAGSGIQIDFSSGKTRKDNHFNKAPSKT